MSNAAENQIRELIFGSSLGSLSRDLSQAATQEVKRKTKVCVCWISTPSLSPFPQNPNWPWGYMQGKQELCLLYARILKVSGESERLLNCVASWPILQSSPSRADMLPKSGFCQSLCNIKNIQCEVSGLMSFPVLKMVWSQNDLWKSLKRLINYGMLDFLEKSYLVTCVCVLERNVQYVTQYSN